MAYCQPFTTKHASCEDCSYFLEEEGNPTWPWQPTLSIPFSEFRADKPSSMQQQPQKTHYEQLGGEVGIRRLVDRFYDLMDSAPEAKNVRALHATSLKQSREKLFMFLSGWTGGPPLYVQRVGNPMLRMRHMPFTISPRESREWLWCMDQALDEQDIPTELREMLREKLHALAAHMVNTIPSPHSP